MEPTSNAEIDLERGFDSCPVCRSSLWKSAKLVVLEGTTRSEGALKGQITDPGRGSSGLSGFLLNDRWFSLDHPLEADIHFTSATELVSAIKEFMLSYSALVQLQTDVPAEPKRLSSWDKRKPDRPSEPKKPEAAPRLPPEPKLPADIAWNKHFVSKLKFNAVFAVLLGIGLTVFIGAFSALLALVYFLVGIPFWFFSSFGENKRLKAEYEKKLQEYPTLVAATEDKHRQEVARYNEQLAQYPRVLQEYQVQCSKIDHAIGAEMLQLAEYRKQLSDYESRKQQALKLRERLWERAQVCMRCGKIYLGITKVRQAIPVATIPAAIPSNEPVSTTGLSDQIAEQNRQRQILIDQMQSEQHEK